MDNAVSQEQGAGELGGVKLRKGVVAGPVVLLVAACAVWFLFHHSSSTARQKVKAEPTVRAVLHLDPFVVNLGDPGGDRFLRVGIDLGITREPEDHSRAGQTETPFARIRDTILMTLTTRDATALLTPAGKANLKDDLIKALREQVPEMGVQEVYFTEFLLQR
jgi:flagellar FliL protein